MGAFIADAMGSFLEFSTVIASEEKMDACMTMPGGGPYNLEAGQYTDDSELAVCLMQGIVNSNKDSKGIFVKDEIAKMYSKWIISYPFDMGNTTGNALNELEYKPFWKTASDNAD